MIMGLESKELAEQLDITPVKARQLMVLRDNYPFISKETVKLNPGRDALIIEAMGWGGGGGKAVKV